MRTNKISKKLAEIMRLCYLINLKTPYAVFFSFSGHVNSIEVRIMHGKARTYTYGIAGSGIIYLDKDKKDRFINLDRLIENLKKFPGQKTNPISLISENK